LRNEQTGESVETIVDRNESVLDPPGTEAGPDEPVAAGSGTDRREGSSPLSPPERAAWRGLMFTHARLLRSLDEVVDEAERLSLSSYEVLYKLTDVKGSRVRMKDIGSTLLMSKSGLTRVVDDLEKRGYVTRERCPTDARGFDVVLTASGRRVYRRAEKAFLQQLRSAFLDRLSNTQLTALADIWETVWLCGPSDTNNTPI
jgi:DNA-binding MarR family transcriptional regulator